MKLMKFRMAALLLCLFLVAPSLTLFCSTLCQPNSCSGISSNSCNNACPTNWIPSGSTCAVDTSLNYTLVDVSQDLPGTAGKLLISPTGTATCTPYTYYGDLSCDSSFQVNLASGIGSPHYAIEISIWVIFLSDNTWSNTKLIQMTLNGVIQTLSMGNWDAQQSLCSSRSQTYYRFTAAFTHQNLTNAAISAVLTTDISSGNCDWGVKQATLIVKKCNSICLTCLGPTTTQCYSCITGYYLSNNTCAVNCLTQFGTVTSSNVCVFCDLKCTSCSENSTFCSACTTSGPNQAFLSSSTCVNPCPGGTVSNSTTHTCDSCPVNCSVCTSSSVCTTCLSGMGWLNSSCYSTCPTGYYLSGSNCTACDSYCSVCSGSATTCSVCNQTFPTIGYLWNTACLANCPSGTFSSTNPNICTVCDSLCSVCSGSATACTVCTLSGANIGYLSSNTCVSSCPTGTFTTTNPNVCVACDPLCSVCSGSATACSVCTLTGGSIGYYWNNTCLSSCPAGTYSTTNPNVCTVCDSLCSACSGTSTVCSACTLTGANIGYLHNNSCLANCPSGTFSTTNPNICVTCDPLCSVCSGSATACSVCTLTGGSIGYYLNNTCLSACPTGTYSTTNPNICLACDPKCISCSGSATSCTVCTLSGADIAYYWNSTCLSTCPSNAFVTTNPNICNACDALCLACTGSTSAECSACASGYTLSNSTCDVGCLTQFGQTTNTSLCVYCSAYCTACYQLADNCTSCTTSGTYQAFHDFSVATYKKCTATCTASASFANSVNHQCDPCNVNCTSCGTTSNNCFSCITSFGWLSYTCYSPCPATYFLSGTNCTSCDVLCSACSGTATTCSACTLTGANIGYLLSTTCYSTCPAPYYPSTNGGTGPNVCLACNVACQTCTDNTNIACQSCKAGYTLSGSTCSSSCLTGYGITSDPLVCILCSAECLTCAYGSTNCIDCSTSSTYYLLLVGVDTYNCVLTCPTTHFHNTTALTCDLCPVGCTSCVNDTSCPECDYASGYAWTTDMCYNPCPIGYFKESSMNCTRCEVECAYCTNIPANCTSCMPNGTYRSYLLGSVCYPICPAPYYGDGSTSTCKPCNSACAICFGGGSNACYQCQGVLVKSGNTCAATCIANYGITNDPFVCVRCNATCTACSYISTNCSACVATGNFSAFLYTDNVTYPKCLMTCPIYYFGNTTSRVCSPCATGCANCSNSSTNCSACLATYGLLNTSCLNPCPSHYFLNGTLCSLCSSTCLECTGLNTTCTSCVFNGTGKRYFLNGTCLTNCPNGTYKFDNATLGPTLCLTCNTTCLICSIDADNCSKCVPGRYLYLSACQLTCPAGYFPFNTTWTCVNASLVRVNLLLNMYMEDSTNQRIFVDLTFDYDLDQATFPVSTFQNFTFNDPNVNMSLFTVSYVWTSSKSYRIILQPSSFVFLYNCSITVTVMDLPSPVHQSQAGVPFAIQVYGQTANLIWFLIKGPDMTDLQKMIINGLDSTSTSITSFTTLPGLQQLNKAGVFALLFAGAQITSSAIVLNSIHSQNYYEGSRFWANFIYFEVPKWQQNRNKTKYVFSPFAEELAKDARLLGQRRNTFETDSIYWRFQRTGFTTFFIYDCYMQLFMIALCWVMVWIGKFIQRRKRWNVLSRVYPIFHKLHELTIFYFSMGLVLQWLYFDSTSIERIASLSFCFLVNVYYLCYELYIYYDMIKYPTLQIGTQEYRNIAIKYSYFLRNVRYEEYDDLVRWSPKHWFRPYNYHLLSYYKKFLMIFTLPLFYQYPRYEMGVLIALQLFEIVRFLIVWPFASKRRNIFRLCLEIVLLVFFISGFIQNVFLSEIKMNNPLTIQDQTRWYYIVGWVGFAAIFIFNISFFLLLLVDFVMSIRKSNRESMREIRKQYYYEKIVKYENSYENHIDMETLDAWVAKGDLNEKWIEDEKMAETIDITIEKYIITKMGDGFTVQVEKISELEMKTIKLEGAKQKVKVQEQLTGTIGLTKAISLNFFTIIQDIYNKYDLNYTCDYTTIKTVAKIDLSKYKPGDSINLDNETLIQTLTFVYPDEKKETHRLSVPIKGFPLNSQLLKPLVTSHQLNKNRL